MNKNWSKTTLASLGKISMCKRILKEETSELGDIPFYKISTFGEVADAFISKDIFEKYRETYSYPKIGDILISAAGTLGKTVIFDGKPSYFQDSNIVWVANDEKTVINSFLYYFYQTNPWVKTTGSTINRLYNNDIKNLEIYFPDLKTQQSIAAILSALDKKIALNKQINARLEEMAKTLYDYWFVQFDFPDTNGKPYKSSGGEMVFDETLKREIPKGWEVKSLKDVLVNCSDNIKSEDLTSNMPYTPIDSLPMRKMTFSDFQKIENARTSLIRYSFNDILIGAMRVYFHRVCIAPFDGITRSTTIVLKPKKQNHLPFLYQLCNEEKTINFASKVSIGTQQPYVNWVNGLAEYKFAMPNLELIERYSIKIMPLIKSVITREKQNHHLTQLRDFLLPMLMNGQVSVAD